MKTIDKVRGIVARGQYGKIDGVTLDLFSAGAIIAVYDLLSAENRARFDRLSVDKMARLAFKFSGVQS